MKFGRLFRFVDFTGSFSHVKNVSEGRQTAYSEHDRVRKYKIYGWLDRYIIEVVVDSSCERRNSEASGGVCGRWQFQVAFLWDYIEIGFGLSWEINPEWF